MKTAVLMALMAAILVGAEAYCHNSTGTCLHNGKFECLDGSFVTHAQRCDGVEDCKDGIDEFMCPKTAPGHHEVHEEANCGPTCTCREHTTIVMNTNTNLFNFAVYAPTWDSLMTGTPLNGRWGCNPLNTKTLSVTMKWYKKGASSCFNNRRERGFICCGRQTACACVTGVSGARCT